MGYRKGSPKAAQIDDCELRFYQFVVKEPSGCWEWIGARTQKGYGQFTLASKVDVYAHRFSWEMFNGETLPARLAVLHTCDNPSCVNPHHLRAGTIAQNQQDMARKWRSRSELTSDDIRAIRASNEPLRVLAKRYGLKSHNAVSCIKSRRTFSHVA